ncbi:MAG: ribonuclease T2 [Acidobacteriaceae bacterium]|nr:ribonuclease T2 [Acidobacteriaceae bacterium]MBV9778731.1 ribonuclease T2 [Acidobacteriaceae bacterium]
MARHQARAGLIVCLLLTQASCVGRQHTSSSSGVPGEFDYYVLAFSWAPSFCAHEGENRKSGECAAGRETGFIVHGLWPERNAGQRLENCAPVPPVRTEIVDQMLPLMSDSGLIQHEWRTHGSCTGLSVDDYFRTVRRAAERIGVPAFYRALHHAVETSPVEIERRFAGFNHLRGLSALRVLCRQGELREVRVCLTRGLDPHPCAWNMRDCRAAQIFVRPIP